MVKRGLPKRSGLAIVFLCVFLSIAHEAHAAFQLIVTPRRGGQTIRFESAQPGGILRNEEVTVQIQSDRGSQYRLYQTVYQPLTNEFGNTIPQGTFFMFSPSTTLGTLKTQMETPISMGQVPIYISNTTGESDEFTMVYNVHVPEDQPGGVYRTQLTLTAELLNAQGGVSPSSLTLDVRVEISPVFRISIQSVKGAKSLDLGAVTKDRPVANESLKIVVESNIGNSYRIIQQMTDPLTSADGVVLDESFFTYQGAGGQSGKLAVAGSPVKVPVSPTPLYTSSDNGAGDTIQLEYQVQSAQDVKAGIYSGNLTLKAESTSSFVSNEVINVPIKVEVAPIFYLEAQSDQGGSRLHFGVFKNAQDQQQRRVQIKIHSNLGQPYQVTQIVSRKMTNETGTILPGENFTYCGTEAKSGVLSSASPVPVEQGEKVVFTSDKKGTPESFFLNYSIKIPQDVKSGSYSSEVKYSITTV